MKREESNSQELFDNQVEIKRKKKKTRRYDTNFS